MLTPNSRLTRNEACTTHARERLLDSQRVAGGSMSKVQLFAVYTSAALLGGLSLAACDGLTDNGGGDDAH